MSDDPLNSWPSYSQVSRDQYHALGVIAANFNRLEFGLLGLFLTFQAFDKPTIFLFTRLRDNALRIDILLRNLEERAQTAEIKEAVEYFCKSFGTCADNRNILMHARIESMGVEKLWFKKLKIGVFDDNIFETDIGGLRRIADEIRALINYGQAIMDFLLMTYQPNEWKHSGRRDVTWPQKPPPPFALIPRPPLIATE